MKKSDFFELVKSLPAKPDAIYIHGKMVCVSITGDRKQVLIICKTLENAAKEMHKFNRWLSEALEEIHPSDTQWMPEEEKLKPGLHEAKINSVGFIADKVVCSMHVGGQVISMSNKIHAVEKQKSPARMFVRATLNIMKQWDCFDSLKNPHWSNLSKKQKKSWARNFGIEMMECWIESCAMDLASDSRHETGHDTLENPETEIQYYLRNKSLWNKRAIKQLLAEMDYSSVEEYVEENLNCLW